MRIGRLLTPWWTHTPDPPVTTVREREDAARKARDTQREAATLAAFMRYQRQTNHFSARIAAAHQEHR